MRKNFIIKVLILIFFMVKCYSEVFSQNFEGEIIYDRNYYWVKVNNQLPYLSLEERERMQYTYGKKDGWTTKMKLSVSNNQTLYTYLDEGASENPGWTWRQDEFIIFRDLNTMKRKELNETMGKIYLIDEELRFPKWKILNEIKEVAGYLCMKAETTDTIKNQKIAAWFTDQIPVSGGPELLCGLPGMILELDINNGAVIITATKVTKATTFKALPLPKKWRGKLISNIDLQKNIQKHILDAVKNKQNPYWGLRY